MDKLYSCVADIAHLSPSQLIQSTFLLIAALVCFVLVLPAPLTRPFLAYGPRTKASTPPPPDLSPSRENDNSQKGRLSPSTSAAESVHDDQDRIGRLIVRLGEYGQVPHSWFWHFYGLSVAWTVFWAWQFATQGKAMAGLAVKQSGRSTVSTEIGQVYVAWAMMALQGGRRLYENMYVHKIGSSRMSFLHWLLGIVYYTCVGVAVWVDGSDAILAAWQNHAVVRLLTPKILVAVTVYAYGAINQYECHRYLASLKKYTLPDRGLFRYLISPHYSCECLIYVAFAIATAPAGYLLNRTFVCVEMFILVVLGVTAKNTKQWNVEKFGADKVADRWMLVPFVF